MLFEIPEINYDAFNKKVTTILKKCKAHKVNYTCELKGEEFRTIKIDHEEVIMKYFIFDVEAHVTINGWTFVAQINHEDEGNIIRVANPGYEAFIPKSYRTSDCVCDHCKTMRRRNSTYLIYNEKDHEFKQVGRDCLKLYTNGLDAQHVAYFESFIKTAQDMQHVGSEILGTRKVYIDRDKYLGYCIQVVKNCGYVRSQNFNPSYHSAYRYMRWLEDHRIVDGTDDENTLDLEVEQFHIHKVTEADLETVADLLNYLNTSADDSMYMHDVRITLASKYLKLRNLAFACSSVVGYNKYLEQKTKAAEVESRTATTNYVGSIGDKLEIDVVSAEIVTSHYGYYGPSFMYRFEAADGNIFTWWTSKGYEDDVVSTICKVRGTIKDHVEYKGEKQNQLTRCRVVFKEA